MSGVRHGTAQCSPSSGWLAHSSMNSTTASENSSVWVSGLAAPTTISGAMYWGVPLMPV